MARITRINANIARQVLHSMVARADDEPFHSKKVTKNTFEKEVLRKAEGKHLSIFRGTRDSVTRNEMKHSVKELTEFLKAHPKFAPNRRALELMGIHAYEGSALRENFNSEESLKKVDRYAVGEQKDQDASKDTGPTPEEIKRQERHRLVNIATGRSLRMREEDAGKKASGYANPTLQAGYVGGDAKQAGTSATTRGENVQTSVTGDSTKSVAGQSAARRAAGVSGAAIPGQHASPPSRGSVQLAGGIGLNRIEGRPADRTDDIAIPRIGIAKDDPGTEKTVPTPGLKTEVTDIRPVKDDDDALPSTEDIDKNLPLAA